ncbi:MAG: hypothetical protein RLZZ360_947 [Candidatus Parcubacteria bacterium]|jgi:hypothetical protein
MEALSITPLLQLGFYLIAIVYATFTAVLFYHWQSYSVSSAVTLQTYTAFALFSLPLLIVMAAIAFL